MNSAFKFDTLVLFISLLSATTSMSAGAIECATLSVDADNQQIVSIANKIMKTPIYLAPGWHTMTMTQVNSAANTPRKSYDFTVQVSKNQHYQLAIVSPGQKITKNDKAQVKIVKQIPSNCDANDNITIYPAHFSKAAGLTSNAQLPAQLEYRLRKLMSKIANYHGQTSAEQTPANVLIGAQMNQFGAVLDSQNPSINTGVQVLAVSPLSQASKLGLTSGDRIISLGTLPLNNQTNITHHSVERYINQLVFGDTIAMTIKRHGKRLSLNGTFQPVTIPSAFYQL